MNGSTWQKDRVEREREKKVSIRRGEPSLAAPVITIEGYFLTALMMRSDDA